MSLTNYPFTLLQAAFFDFVDWLAVDAEILVNN